MSNFAKNIRLAIGRCYRKTRIREGIMIDLNTLIDSAPQNYSIVTTLLKARLVLSRYSKIAVSTSGGSDSDIITDLVELVKPDNCEIRYVFFNTGLEYFATLQHLDYLEQKYGVAIDRRKPRKTIPVVCREHGVPFISKDVSEFLNRLQSHGFDWNDTLENSTFEKYGRCKSALDWYFNVRPPSKNGKSKYCINRYKLLREFIMANPPDFAISEKCCYYCKKQTATDFNKEYNPDLSVNGMRQAEGGRRAGIIKNCFTAANDNNPANYRPLWKWTDYDKAVYKAWRGLVYSDCYEVYGMSRTGCTGCPCGSRAEQELALIEPFEPNIVKAARNIFGATYDYRRRYVEFKKK
jgi:3'-phosphoadenosine 5'-phosphosulfate sulfotransferase (PAPS reductase)/FAD synthetase